MSYQMRKRKERLKRLLQWVKAQEKGVTQYELNEWLFINYALGEKSRQKYIEDLRNFQFLIVKGNKLVINPRKRHDYWIWG